jgi:hypothetical protein
MTRVRFFGFFVCVTAVLLIPLPTASAAKNPPAPAAPAAAARTHANIRRGMPPAASELPP